MKRSEVKRDQRKADKYAVGLRIKSIDLRAFEDGRELNDSRRVTFATDPVIVLEDGTRLCFTAQETEVACYGVKLFILRPAEIVKKARQLGGTYRREAP